jgi:hypothetical protein
VLGSSASERDVPASPTLSEDWDDAVFEIDVIGGETEQFPASDTGVGQQPDDPLISTVLERRSSASAKQRTNVLLAWHCDRLLGDARRPRARHRADGNVLLVGQPVEELLEGSEPVVRRGRDLVETSFAMNSSMCSREIATPVSTPQSATWRRSCWMASPYVSTVLGDLFSAYRWRSNDLANLSSSPTLPIL